MKARIGELDALRGVAALYVLLFHYTMFIPQVSNVFAGGITGVDLFFMISGFVIFMTLETTRSIGAFAINRFTRLFPTYWVCVTITFIVLVCVIDSRLFLIKSIHGGAWSNTKSISFVEGYGWNMTMLQHYAGIKDIDGVYWTLLIELLFYVVIGFVFVAKLMRYVNYIGFLLTLFCLINGMVIIWAFPSVHTAIKFWFPLINYFPLFFAGILFYKMKFRQQYFFSAVLLGFCFITQILLWESNSRTQLFIGTGSYFLHVAAYFIIFSLFAFDKLKFIAVRPLLFLGLISYPLYLLHQAIGKKYLIPMFYEKYQWGLGVSLLLTTAIIIGLAVFVTAYVEKPSVTTLKRKLYSIAGIK